MKILKQRRGIMGIGMLIIFISTILVSAVAAGVLIRTTGLLQQRALLVEESTRERLVNGVEIQSVIGFANVTNETIGELEFLARLRAGSTPVRMSSLGLTLVSGQVAISAELNSSISGNSTCTFTNLGFQTEYCFEPRLGDANLILEEGELFTLRYKLNTTNALAPQDNFEVSFLAGSGAVEVLELRVPDVVLTSRIRIR